MTPTADIRRFMVDTFSDEDLKTLCFDYFRDVFDDFTTGMTKGQMIQLLIERCVRRDALANLEAALRAERPDQYVKQFGAPTPPPVSSAIPAEIAPAGRDPRQVFISHAHQEADFAHRLAADLTATGWRAWIVPESIQPGEKWVEAIGRGLDGSGVFVVALTPAAVASNWVRNETNAAIELDNRGEAQFIPLDVATCTAPTLWNVYQRVPFQGRYEDGLAALLRRLGMRAGEGEIAVALQMTTQTRRVEAALPSCAALGATVDLLVRVSLPESPPLTGGDFPGKQKPNDIGWASELTGLEFPIMETGRIGFGDLEIRVVTDDFHIVGLDRQKLQVPPDEDSRVVKFFMRTKHLGDCRVNVEVHDQIAQYLGTAAVEMTVVAEPVPQLVVKVVRLSLNLVVSTLDKLTSAQLRVHRPAPPRIEVAEPALRLSGAQVRDLMAALLDAYDEGSLRQKVRFQLDEHLDLIAGGDNLSQIVFNLIAWAERTGRITALIGKAQAYNPGNARLAAFARSVAGIPVVEPAKVAPQALPATPAQTRAVPAADPIAFDWVTIPAGEFLMGSDKQKDKLAFDNETPQHTLNLPEYRIARVPVTVAQFAAFVGATRYKTTAEQQGASWSWSGSEPGTDWAHPRGPESDVRAKQDHPVTCVSWHDAVAFCKWAGVRLPTEAEWEKAARGTDGRIWLWGNKPPNNGLCNCTMGDTTPVGRYPGGKSPYGLLDVAGNVCEWTSSLWGKEEQWDRPEFGYPYDPQDGRENLNAPDKVRRVLRGGSFWDDAQGVRCACRDGHCPDEGDDFSGGFRVVSPGF